MKNAIIWGMGNIGKRVYGPLTMEFNYNIIAYVDSNESLQCKNEMYIGGKYLPIISPECVCKEEFEILFVAVYDYNFLKQIKNTLMLLEIPNDKIVYLAEDLAYMDVFLDERYKWIRKYAEWIDEKRIDGNVAECGVFRGDSAKFINKYFPNRKLYLFDTFEGFNAQDVDQEYSINGGNDVRFWDEGNEFEKTAIEFVMKKMNYPENVVIKKGYFPDSANGVDDKFCFVNLDMDLHVPMLNGLRFFWDKMEIGGCILLHDYFSEDFPGVRLAVEIFEQELGRDIPKIPIGDMISMVLIKY